MQTGFVQLLERGTEIRPQREDVSRTELLALRDRTWGHRHDAGLRPRACKPCFGKRKHTSEGSESRGRGSSGCGGQRSYLLTKVFREGPAQGSPGRRVREAAPCQRDFGERSCSIRKAFKCPGPEWPLPRSLGASIIITRVSLEEGRRPPAPSAAPGGPLPGSTPPERSRSGRAEGGGAPADARSLTEGQQDAAEAQHPQDPHGERTESRKSSSVAGAVSAPPPRVLRSSHLQPRGRSAH